MALPTGMLILRARESVNENLGHAQYGNIMHFYCQMQPILMRVR